MPDLPTGLPDSPHGLPWGPILAVGAGIAAFGLLAASVVSESRSNPTDLSSLKLQTIIVSKDRASSKSEARRIASRFARLPVPAADETGRSYRFRQRDPSDFIPGSFRTIHPTDGVALVLGHLR